MRSIQSIFQTFLFILFTCPVFAQGSIEGTVTDKKSGEPIIGAAILVKGTTQGTATDSNGKYVIRNISDGKYELRVSYISYAVLNIQNVIIQDGKTLHMDIALEEVTEELEEVTVRAERRMNNEVAMISAAKAAPVVMNGVSGQLIQKTQDRDAGEIVKRLPGVSVMNDRFIILRGLSQRYNSVWINNMPAPSSEADQRAFSFDVLPGGVIDNMMILKTSSAEYPADYSGGFISIKTKGAALEDSYSVSIGTGFETGTTFKTFRKNPAGSLTWLGFNDGKISLPASAGKSFVGVNPSTDHTRLEKIARDFNTVWEPETVKGLPDLRLGFSMSKKVYRGEVSSVSNMTAVNFSNSRSSNDKNVNQWGIYDERYQKPLPLSLNEQRIYKQSAKLSVLHNWIFALNPGNTLEFRNFFNNISANRTIERYQDKNPNKFRGTELSFTRRMTYTGQFSGRHFLHTSDRKLDWTVGYSYTDKAEPDQKQYDYEMDAEGKYYLPVSTTPNINRISNQLDEHIVSGSLNYSRRFRVASVRPELKAGIYGEYKTRKFKNRWFIYLPSYPGALAFYDKTPNQLMNGEYFRDEAGGIRIQEMTERSDSYDANNLLAAAYVSALFPVTSWLTLSGGVRAEENIQRLNSFRQSTGSQAVPLEVKNEHLNYFPSAMLTFIVNPNHQFRIAYSSSINRPEFREIAPYVFYDYENDVTVNGNAGLKDCRMQGVDVRYEWYPSAQETVTLAFFYKDFSDMIELVQMGSLYPITYKYENIPGGKSYGLEVEVRKELAKEGALKNFSLLLNASWIKSRVKYQTGYESRTREMQGQSPYIVNTGVFYQNDKIGLSLNVLYNVIGKRIVVNGDYSSVTPEMPEAFIPDTYEMPRHILDVNLRQRLWKSLELKVSARDLICDPEELRQTYQNGYVAYREKSGYGRKFLVSLGMSF